MKRLLIVTFDVTGLDARQISAIAGDALAQREASDDHPDVAATHEIVEVASTATGGVA